MVSQISTFIQIEMCRKRPNINYLFVAIYCNIWFNCLSCAIYCLNHHKQNGIFLIYFKKNAVNMCVFMHPTRSTLLIYNMDFIIRPHCLYTVYLSVLSKQQQVSDGVMFMKSLFRFVLLILHILLSAGLWGESSVFHICLCKGYSSHPFERT